MNDYFEDTEFSFYLCKLIGDTNVEILMWRSLVCKLLNHDLFNKDNSIKKKFNSSVF